MDILNYAKIDDAISTSGQPRAEQFAAIGAQGFRNVVNLALPTSDNAIADEGSIVTGLGMNYFHLPVPWETPSAAQFEKFSRLMDALQGEPTWVHCALNMRVSCFLYLYQTLNQGMDEAQARARMRRIWDPDEYPAWKALIAEVRRGTERSL